MQVLMVRATASCTWESSEELSNAGDHRLLSTGGLQPSSFSRSMLCTVGRHVIELEKRENNRVGLFI